MFLKLISGKCCHLRSRLHLKVSLRLEVLDVAAREVVPATQRPGVDSLLLKHKLCQDEVRVGHRCRNLWKLFEGRRPRLADLSSGKKI